MFDVKVFVVYLFVVWVFVVVVFGENILGVFCFCEYIVFVVEY